MLSIHLGPCLDQYPACGSVALLGSPLERGGLDLRKGGGYDAFGGVSGVVKERSEVDSESDWASHGLGMDNLRNHQSMGVSHANRLQGLAIAARRKFMNMKVTAIHYIR